MDYPEFKIIEGQTPVLLSAPHVFSHRRPSMRGVMKQGEEKTDELVKSVAGESGCFGIFTTVPTLDFDPNYSKIEDNTYKQEIKKLFSEKKVKYLFDIHGLSNNHNYDFGIFYGLRFKRSKDLTHRLLYFLSQEKELKNLSYYLGYTSKNLQETITEYVNEKLRFPAFQVEIAKYIREDKALFAAVKRAFVNFVKEITD